MNEIVARTIINTRPIERAAPLTAHLQASGFDVIAMPMLALQARAITIAEMGLMRAWLAGAYQALVIVSPTAAERGLAMWQQLAEHSSAQSSSLAQPTNYNENIATDSCKRLKAPSQLIAVGTATAKVLQQSQLASASYQVLQPTVANNEGMLAMPEIEQLQAGDKVLVWRGLGGRRLLVDTLQARGVHSDSIAWYERKMPNNALIVYREWLQHCHKPSTKPIVIISSANAFEHWQKVVTQAPLNLVAAPTSKPRFDNRCETGLADFIYIVLGERLANILAAQQLDYLQVVDLLPDTISSAIYNIDKL